MISAFLFLIALVLRLNNLDRDPYGDEAFYFYLARHPQVYFATPEASSHPPLLYYLYYPFSQTLANFRLVNILVGAMVPCLVYLILVKKNVKWPIRFFISIILTFHSIFVKYSAVVFLDMLGTFFALMALLFYLRGNNKVYSASLFLALMTKEYFVIFALTQIATYFLRKHSIHRPTAIALGLFGLWSFVYYFIKGLPMFLLYGHSRNPLNLAGLNRMFIVILLVPVIILTFKMTNIEFLSISAVYPIFLYFWGTCEEWYLILPIAINSCLVALALNQLLNSTLNGFPRSLTRKKIASATLIILAIAMAAEFYLTVMYIQEPPTYDLREVANYLRDNYYDRNIAMIDCFWAYKYYPLGEFMYVRYEGWSNQESFENLRWKIGQVGLCILGKTDTTINLMLQESFMEFVVFENTHFIIIYVPTP